MPQGSTTFHEAEERLSSRTRDMHRAIVSLMEELEAIDWYQQRMDATEDADLRAILAFEVTSAFVICLGTVGVLGIYEEMDAAQFWRVVAFSELCVALALLFGARRIRNFMQPLLAILDSPAVR